MPEVNLQVVRRYLGRSNKVLTSAYMKTFNQKTYSIGIILAKLDTNNQSNTMAALMALLLRIASKHSAHCSILNTLLTMPSTRTLPESK